MLVNSLMLAATPERWPKTAGRAFSWFFLGRQGMDSWDPLGRAMDYFDQEPRPQKPVYEKLLYRHQEKPFQYPPSAILLPRAARAAAGEHWLVALKVLTWLSIPVLGLVTVLLLEGGLRQMGCEMEGRRRVATRLMVGLLALGFYPAMAAYRAGQVQALLNAAFGGILLAWSLRRERLAGLLLGFACLVKPQWTPVLLWGVLRRRWGFVAAFCAVAGLGLAVSLAIFGLGPHVEYVGALSFLSRRGESFYPNQSLNGLLNRLLMNGENLERPGFPPFHPWVYAGTLAGSALFLFWAFFGKTAREEKGSSLEVASLGLACTMASPIAWEHHYGILLPIYALLLPRLLAFPVLGPRTMPVLALSWVLTANLFTVADWTAASRWNVLQSYLLAGAFVVLFLLQLARRRGRFPQEAGATAASEGIPA